MAKLRTDEQIERHKKKAKEWYQANKVSANAASAAWALANPEKRAMVLKKSAEKNAESARLTKSINYKINAVSIKKKHAVYYSENKEKSYQAVLIWRKDNPEKIKKYKKKWVDANTEGATRYHHARRARKANNGGVLSVGIVAVLLKLQRGKCAICKTELAVSKHHLDHIIPFALGGENSDFNVQLLCPKCNLAKHARDPIDFMQSRGFLI